MVRPHVTPSEARSRTAMLLLCALLAVNAAVLLSCDIFPFTDIPNHLAEATIIRELHAGNPAFVNYYRVEVGPFKPNIAHMVFCSLFSNVETGNKVSLGVYFLATPLLIVLLIRRTGGSIWVGLLSVLVLYNFNLAFGFIPYSLGITAFLLYLLVQMKACEDPDWKWKLLLALIFVLLFWIHVIVFLFALFCFLLVEALQLRKAGKGYRWYRPVLALPAAFLFLTWRAKATELAGADPVRDLFYFLWHLYLPTIPGRIGMFFWNDFARLAEGPARYVIGACFSLAIFIPLLKALLASSGLRSRWPVTFLELRQNAVRRLPAQDPVRQSPARKVALCFLAAATCCYLFLPSNQTSNAFLFERFSVFMLVGAIIVLSWVVRRIPSRAAIWGAGTVSLVYCLFWWQYLLGFQAFAKGFDRELLAGPEMRGTMMAAIIDEKDYRGFPAVNHYNDYQIVWNKGPAPTSILDYNFGAIRRASSTEVLPVYEEGVTAETDPVPLLTRYEANCEYLLVRGDRVLHAAVDSGKFRTLHTSGNWALLQRR